MHQYNIISMQDIIDDEELVQELISAFSCPLNPEVEVFLRDKSVEFEKMDLSRTYFVFGEYHTQQQLLGYFAISIKNLNMADGVSNKNRKKIAGYSSRKNCPVHLIGQLAKNYRDNINDANLITGQQLLRLAIEKIMLVHRIIGGRAILIECEDRDVLRQFYEKQGFQLVDKDQNDDLLRYYIGIDSIEL